MRSASELSLPSEVGEDGESAPSHHSSAQSLHTSHDGTDGGNFVNPKGVKFIPHQHTHEGKLFKIDVFFLVFNMGCNILCFQNIYE